MNKIIAALFLGVILSLPAFADKPDEHTLEIIQKGCSAQADKAAKKAGDDLLAVIGAYGGNISYNLTQEIEAAKPEFRWLYAASCEAEAIRKFNVKTRFSID